MGSRQAVHARAHRRRHRRLGAAGGACSRGLGPARHRARRRRRSNHRDAGRSVRAEPHLGPVLRAGFRAQHRDDDGARDAALHAQVRHHRGAVRQRRRAGAPKRAGQPFGAPEGRDRHRRGDAVAAYLVALQAVRHLPSLGRRSGGRAQQRDARASAAAGRPSSPASPACRTPSSWATAWDLTPIPTSPTSPS